MSLPAPNPDRTCLVTGASSGIGEEIAGLLAARGLGITLVARTKSKLQALADTLVARHGVRVEVLATDLADAGARAELPARVETLVRRCSLCTPGRVERRSGCILNVASTAAFQPVPGQAGYGASKAFVLSYSHGCLLYTSPSPRDRQKS